MNARKADAHVQSAAAARCLHLGSTLLACACLLGCVSHPDGPYKLYPGPRRPAEELALVRLDEVSRLRIDGLAVDRADWSEVELLPGEHRIAWVRELYGKSMWGGSWSGKPLDYEERPLAESVELLAGHRYVVIVIPVQHPHPGHLVEVRDWNSGQVVARRGPE